MEKSTGAAYADGSFGPDGKPIDGCTVFKLAQVTKTKKPAKAAKGEAPTTGVQAEPVKTIEGVVRVVNKSAMLERANAIAIVYPTIQNPTPEQQKVVSVKAAIEYKGSMIPASFKYEVEEKKADETGSEELVTVQKTFSVALRTHAAITSETPNAEFGTAEEAKKYGTGVGLSSIRGKEAVNYADAEAITKLLNSGDDKDQLGLVKLLAACADGLVDSPVDEGTNAIVAQIKSASAGADAAQAAQAADEMADETL